MSSSAKAPIPFREYSCWEPYPSLVRSGLKTVEARVFADYYKGLKLGQVIGLYNRTNLGVLCQITHVTPYANFSKLLQGEEIGSVLPHLDPKKRSALKKQGLNTLIEKFYWQSEWTLAERIKAGVNIYKQFPGYSRVWTLGAVAIGVKYLSNYTHVPQSSGS